MKARLPTGLAAVCALFVMIMASGAAHAQAVLTADWTNLGKASLQEVTSGEVLLVGPNNITITTRVNKDGDSNDGNFTNYYSTGMLSYYSGQVSSQTGSLLYSMDHSVFDAGDYFETTYTLASSVTNLQFTVGNVDQYLNNPYFHDAVVIEYDTGTGSWLNLRSLPTAYTLGSAVGTTTINGQQGFQGTTYSGGITSTTGDIRVNLGALTVKRVRIRYLFGQGSPNRNPSGNYQYIGLSDFTWVQPGVSVSDLSLSKTVSASNPAPGAAISYTLRLTNSGPSAASNVVVRDVLPTGFAYTGSAGYGTFDSATGDWTITSVASGAFREITLNGIVTAPAGVSVTNLAEVYSSPNYDPDSVANNGASGEDDLATATFTVQGTRTAGTPPVLSCPAGSVLFDWDTRSWTAGSLNNTYALTGIGNISFAVSSTGTWVYDASFGGLSPSLGTANTGGLPGSQVSLHQYLDFADRNQTATTVISLPTAAPGAQFTVFDIDYAVNDFADQLTVTGTYQGISVTPTLTNGVVNYVVGNQAVGDGGSSGTSSDGNVVVTFSQPVDTITIVYGNANTAPDDPDGQAIAIHDMTFCKPVASLSVVKTSVLVSDPVNGATNPKAIPGAVLRYSILVSNSGVSAVDDGSTAIRDDVPPEAAMCLNDLGGGPVQFIDGSPTSNLTYVYSGLVDLTDGLQFSNDGGASWSYQPTPDGSGCDGAITNFRVLPTGSFHGGGSFRLEALFVIE